MDEFCVAVSILNRVRSPKYPNAVANVVYSPDNMKVSDTETCRKTICSQSSKEYEKLLRRIRLLEVAQTLKVRECSNTELHLKIRCAIIKVTSITTTGRHD